MGKKKKNVQQKFSPKKIIKTIETESEKKENIPLDDVLSDNEKVNQTNEEILTEDDLERSAAEQAGFHPLEMGESEIEWFPEYSNYEIDYVNTRNVILYLWKKNMSTFLNYDDVSLKLKVN